MVVLLLLMTLTYTIISIKTFYSIRSSNDLLNFISEVNPTDMNNSLPPGDIAPNFTLKNFNNDTYSLDFFLEKPVIMLIIATGCDSCSLDKIEFLNAAKKYTELNFILIVNNHKPGDKELFKEEGLTNFFVLKGENDFLSNYKIRLYPTFIVINRNKHIIGYPVISQHIENYYNQAMVQ